LKLIKWIAKEGRRPSHPQTDRFASNAAKNIVKKANPGKDFVFLKYDTQQDSPQILRQYNQLYLCIKALVFSELQEHFLSRLLD